MKTTTKQTKADLIAKIDRLEQELAQLKESKRHNGWTNYETWCVNLWLDNEEPSYRYWREQAQECWNNAEATQYFTREEQARYTLEDILKQEFSEANPLADEANVWSDLLGAALSKVDWHDIARHLMEEVDQTEDE